MGFLSALLGVSKVETPPSKERTAEAVTPEEASLRLRELPTTRFDLHDVYYLNREYGPLMLVDEKNAPIVNHDIGKVNDLLAQIKKKRRYKIEPIPMPEYGPHGSYMTVAPLTKTGKVTKYPFSINFGDRSNMLSEKSLYQRRENQKTKFTPQAVQAEAVTGGGDHCKKRVIHTWYLVIRNLRRVRV